MTAVEETLRIRADASLERVDGVVTLHEGHIRQSFPRLGPALAELVERLSSGATEDALLDGVGEDAIMGAQLLLRKLDAAGWIERSVVDGARALATLSPVGHDIPPVTRALALGEPVALSRFAYLRADRGEMALETPKASVRLVLHEPRLAELVALLAAPVAPRALEPASLAVLRLLSAGRMLARAGEEDGFELAQWGFHELLMHARSRIGRHLGDYGGSYRFEGVAPLPAVREQFEPAVALPRPPGGLDIPFGRVLEERRSIRAHDDEHPITVQQLGDLLHHAARLRASFRDEKQELSSRPYPSGGASYELELYPLVRRCDGIEPGLYHYDPEKHTLGLVAEPGPRTILLLEYARFTAVMEEPPQVVLLVAARFGRVAWKYESMAYALVLKHVGVVYQTLYLVATALGLAPCALGGGNADAFAAASGLDYYTEPAVGEFVVGSRAETASPHSTT